MTSDFHIYLGNLQPVLDRLDELKALLRQQGSAQMATLVDLQQQVSANTSAEQSAVVLLGQLHELLTAAQGNPAELQAVIDQLGASKEALAAAIVANTPSV